MNCQKCKQEEKNLCPCTYLSCSRHAICCECVSYHRGKSELPACYFDKEQERTYDRSVIFYNQCNGLG